MLSIKISIRYFILVWSFIFLFSSCSFFQALASKNQNLNIQDIRVEEEHGKTIVEVEVNGFVLFTTFPLSSPERIVLEIPEVGLGRFRDTLKLSKGPILSIIPVPGRNEHVSRLELLLGGEVKTDVRPEGLNIVIEVTAINQDSEIATSQKIEKKRNNQSNARLNEKSNFKAEPQFSVKNKTCKIAGYYKICGDGELAQKISLKSGNLINFHKAENSSYEKVTASLKKQDPKIVIRKLNSDDAIYRQWQKLTRENISLELDKYPHNEKINPTYKVIFDAARQKDILMSVDLNDYPFFLTVEKQKINQLCKKAYKNDNSHGSYSSFQFKMIIQKCYQTITGNLEDTWKIDGQVGREAMRALYFYMVSLWYSQIISDERKEYLKENPRKVYVLLSNKPLSPRVDSVGNLYMPDRILKEKSTKDIHLIMMHEVAHTLYYNGEIIVQQLFSNIPKMIKEKYSALTEKERAAFNKAIRGMLFYQSKLQELVVDLYVLKEIFYDREQRYRYQQLIATVEKFYPERAEAMGVINKILDTVIEPELLSILFQDLVNPSEKTNEYKFTLAQKKLAKQYMEISSRYMAGIFSGELSEVISEGQDDVKRIDPMKLEEQLITGFNLAFSLFYELSRQR